ncbi:hypothetical protein ACOMHN_010758 [Nucella lapillus]
MNGVHYLQQPMLDGWGNSGPFFDHTFMGYDRAPYNSLYLPGKPMGPYLGSRGSGRLEDDPPGLDLPNNGMMLDDSLSSDSDDDNNNVVDDGLDVYNQVGLQKILGQQMAVWCHRAPDTLAIFTPIPGDNLQTAVSFARTSLQCDPTEDRVLILQPGQRRPMDPSSLHAVQPGSSMLVVPRHDYVVTLEVSQLKLKLQMVVSVTLTVRQVKVALHKHRGFPANRTDLLFQDQPMENQRHLFEYHVKHGSTMFVMLHLMYDVEVTVETFWGVTYQLYIDPCMTVDNLVDTVLRRTISPQAGHVAAFFHLNLPRHALVMYSENGTAMKWTACLGLYGAQNGATFSLSTIALADSMSLQTIPVVTPGDKVHNFRISQFDYWSVLALKLHGLLGYPVNLMRLFSGKHELELARATGDYSHRAARVHLDMSMLRSDMDVYGGVSLTFKLGSHVKEDLIISPARTVKSVKTMLAEVGVPNATAYDLFAGGVQLPDHQRVGDVIEEHRKPIRLKLRHYPVFVHAPKNVIYKMTAHAQEALKVFKSRVEMKTGLSHTDYYMLMAGLPVADDDSNPVFQSSLAIGSSVFLMALQHRHTIFVVWDDWLVKLRLPFHPQPTEIKEALLKDRNIPEGSLASVGNFLQWFFALRATKKDLLYDYIKHTNKVLQDYGQRQSRPRKRADQAEAALWKKTCRQIEDLQQILEDRYHTSGNHGNHRHRQHPHHHPSPVKDRLVPPLRLQTSSTDSREQRGLHDDRANGQRRHVSPEHFADTCLRAWSMPPDPAHPAHHHSHHHQSRKPHSATPDFHGRKRDHHRHHRRTKDPESVYNLKQMAREDRLEPTQTRATRKKRRKKHASRVR